MNQKPQLIDVNKLAKIPAIKAAMDLASAEAEQLAAAARQEVLDQLFEAEAAMAAMKETASAHVAEAETLAAQQADLAERRTEHEYQMQAQDRALRDLERTLNQEHGGSMITTAVRLLASRAQSMRARAELERSRKLRRADWRGDLHLIPDPVADASAVKLDADVTACEAARTEIAALQYEPLAPQEIQRRINAAVAPLGVTVAAEDVPAQGWQVAGWEDGLVPLRIQSPAA